MGSAASVMTNVSIIPPRPYMEGKLPKKYFKLVLFPTLKRAGKMGFTETMLLKLFAVFLNTNGNETGVTNSVECLHYFGGRKTKVIERIFTFAPFPANVLYNYKLRMYNQNELLKQQLKSTINKEETEVPEAFEYDISAQVSPQAALMSFKYETAIQRVNDFGLSEYDFEDWIIMLWNYCTLTDAQLAQYLFEIFDQENTGLIERADVETMYRMVYDCDDYDKVQVSNIPFISLIDQIDEFAGESAQENVDSSSMLSIAMSSSLPLPSSPPPTTTTQQVISKADFMSYCTKSTHFIDPAIEYRNRLIVWSGGADLWATVKNHRQRKLQKLFRYKVHYTMKHQSIKSKLLTLTSHHHQHLGPNSVVMPLVMCLESLLMRICRDEIEDELYEDDDDDDDYDEKQLLAIAGQNSDKLSEITSNKRRRKVTSTKERLATHVKTAQLISSLENGDADDSPRSDVLSLISGGGGGAGLKGVDLVAMQGDIINNKLKVSELYKDLFRDVENAKNEAEESKSNLDHLLDEVSDTEYYIPTVMKRHQVRLDLYKLLDTWKIKNETYYNILDEKELLFCKGTPEDHRRRYLDYIDTDEGMYLRKLYTIKISIGSVLNHAAEASPAMQSAAEGENRVSSSDQHAASAAGDDSLIQTIIQAKIANQVDAPAAVGHNASMISRDNDDVSLLDGSSSCEEPRLEQLEQQQSSQITDDQLVGDASMSTLGTLGGVAPAVDLPLQPTHGQQPTKSSSNIKFKIKEVIEMNAAAVTATQLIEELARIEQEELNDYLEQIRNNKIKSVPFLLASNILHAKKVASSSSAKSGVIKSRAQSFQTDSSPQDQDESEIDNSLTILNIATKNKNMFDAIFRGSSSQESSSDTMSLMGKNTKKAHVAAQSKQKLAAKDVYNKSSTAVRNAIKALTDGKGNWNDEKVENAGDQRHVPAASMTDASRSRKSMTDYVSQGQGRRGSASSGYYAPSQGQGRNGSQYSGDERSSAHGSAIKSSSSNFNRRVRKGAAESNLDKVERMQALNSCDREMNVVKKYVTKDKIIVAQSKVSDSIAMKALVGWFHSYSNYDIAFFSL